MSTTISIATVPSRPTAVIAAATTWREFPRTWRVLLDQVHAGVRWAGSGRKGRSVMLYLDDLPHVEIGVELDQPATFDGPIVRSSLPAGRVATTVHHGSYDFLGASHDRLVGWVREQGLELAGPRWEVYGHWHEDPRQLVTALTYLLG
ncbi:MAG TPA: GyrI-like domain-containing protein [Nakamurella sp.]